MGVNNKQRRAAKQRKRQRQRGNGGGSRQRQDWFGAGPGPEDVAGAYAVVELRVTAAVRGLLRRKTDDAGLLARAESLLRTVRPQPPELVGLVLADVLAGQAERVAAGGWDDADLEQLVARNAGEQHLGVLRSLLDEPRSLGLHTPERLASGLAVSAQLASAPLLDQRSGRSDSSRRSAEHPKLAQARALLAKAESTDYDDEAEALTAKAQELISRYSLGRLVEDHADDRRAGDQPEVVRIWLDPPYVRAKCALVHEVADANRCRSASAEWLGFCLVLGAPADLEAVELLVTSLLVQADSAMLREGRRVHRSGRSRTRSFRQSFLVAFASRIGERLRAATADAVAAEDTGDLLPVLRDHETRVADAFEAMVPHTVGKATSVSDGEGWRAGLAAADLALLDVNGKLPGERAG